MAMSRIDPPPVDVDSDFEKIVAALASHEAPSTAVTREQQLWLLRRTLCSDAGLLSVLEDPEWQSSVRQAAAPAPVDVYETITPQVGARVRPGDVLNLSYYKLPHKVVVESCNYLGQHKRLDASAIHYGRLGLTYPVTIMREDFQLACDGSSVWLYQYPNCATYSPEETLARAVSRLGERRHHPISNNAATLVHWCKVRDHERNRAELIVPLSGDGDEQLHRLMPVDHVDIEMMRNNAQLHAVLAGVESLDESNGRKLLTIVALTRDVAQFAGCELRTFVKETLALMPKDRLERLQAPFRLDDVRKNAAKYAGVSLCCDCTDLQAMSFLATGVSTEVNINITRFTIAASEVQAGQLITHEQRTQFVLAVRRPEPGSSDERVAIETVQYAPLRLENAPKTSELRLLVDLSRNCRVRLVRHSEPDLQCPVLAAWRFADSPLVTEKSLPDLTDLQPGEAVCIRQDTPAYPLASQMPGLHALVKKVNAAASTGPTDVPSLEVICYTGGENPIVGIRRVPLKGHQISRLVYNVHSSLLSSREEALKLAMARLGTGQYCCAWSGSRDLVRWCCVTHKANAPAFLGQVSGLSSLLALPGLGQNRLRLQQQLTAGGGGIRMREVRVTEASPAGDCVDLAKLSLSGVDWQPSRVRLAAVASAQTLRVSRVRGGASGSSGDDAGEDDNGEEEASEVVKQLRSAAIDALLGATLVNASDRRLGCGVTDRDFCAWLSRSRRPGLSDLAVLLAASSSMDGQPDDVCLTETEPGKLRQWDHVVVEMKSGGQPPPGVRPLHLLVSEFDTETGVLRGYTYGPPGADVEQQKEEQLVAYVYFPPDRAPHPMHKVVQRVPQSVDTVSSELSASLAAAASAASFPGDAAAWAQMAVVELESDLLLIGAAPALGRCLKLLLRFGFSAASDDGLGLADNEGALRACRVVLATQGFAQAMKAAADGICEAKSRRLYFLARLAACLLGPEASDRS